MGVVVAGGTCERTQHAVMLSVLASFGKDWNN